MMDRIVKIEDDIVMGGFKYETKKKVKTIEQRLDTFANLEHIDQLKNVLLPRVETFSEQIDEYNEDNIQMK